MSRVTCSLLLLACIMGLSLPGHGKDGAPASVKDLQYGEVLFHYYRQDYFNSIVRLNIAQKQQRLPHHGREAELLLGGLDLSYGLRNSANEIFTRLLNDDNTGNAIRNRAWFHLAKISYQRGDPERALYALEQIKGSTSESNRAEAIYLQSLLLLKQGRNAEAIKVMQESNTDKSWKPFLTYNLGIAHIRTRQLTDGAELLEQIGQTDSGTEELRLLRDKANLALGFTYLKQGTATQSRQALDRVRLEGILSNKALLGAGWADAGSDAYGLALVPWMELGQRDAADPAVQEALLAIPYAMTKMSLHGQAVDRYNNAIEILLEERHRLDQSIEDIRNGGLLDALKPAITGNDTGWLKDIAGIDASPALRYQVQLMASYDFQEAVTNFRDLLTLQDNLHRWESNMASYENMLATRKLRYEKHQPAAHRALDSQVLSGISVKHNNLQKTIAAVEAGNNSQALANSTEAEQWRRLQDIGNRLDQLPDSTAIEQLRGKYRFLKGVLYWQVNADYKPRLWQAKQQLAELGELITRSEHAASTLRLADVGMPAGMTAFSKRAGEKKQEISSLLKQSDGTLKKQGRYIENLAIIQLEKQKQRLERYLTQACFALAQTYDVALSAQPGPGPGSAQ
jgi:hypothetical protein